MTRTVLLSACDPAGQPVEHVLSECGQRNARGTRGLASGVRDHFCLEVMMLSRLCLWSYRMPCCVFGKVADSISKYVYPRRLGFSSFVFLL